MESRFLHFYSLHRAIYRYTDEGPSLIDVFFYSPLQFEMSGYCPCTSPFENTPSKGYMNDRC